MNASCPSCYQETDVDQNVGDFPTRCFHCGGMLRLPADETCEPGSVRQARSLRLEAAPMRRAPRGELAGMLLNRPEPALFAMAGGSPPSMGQSNPLPETLADEARARSRAQALKRAQLRGNQEALGALGWVGLGVAAVLAVVAIGLKAREVMNHRATSRADSLHMP